jgi:hypothetical protein
MFPLTVIAVALLVLCIVRMLLLIRPPSSTKLPHPSQVPGMPMAGPASQQAAHAALARRGAASRPKFRT